MTHDLTSQRCSTGLQCLMLLNFSPHAAIIETFISLQFKVMQAASSEIGTKHQSS